MSDGTIANSPAPLSPAVAPAPSRARPVAARTRLLLGERTCRHMLSRGAHIVKIWLARWHGRRELRALDDGTLQDVGISRADVVREADKPFWRP
jgi:uncharacterized protein YjiS (DUF1127 family)